MSYPKLKGKRLLVLGGASYMPYIKEYAKQECFKVFCAGGTHNAIMEKFADEFFFIEASDKTKIEKLIIEKKIDGLVALGNEHLIDVSIDITESLGIPFYIKRSHWNDIQNKEIFKKHCSEFGIDVVREYDLNEVSYTDSKSVKYPLVVKPVDGSGSQGISVCNNLHEVNIAIEKAIKVSSTKQYIIEEYILAPEFIATYIIKNGQPTIWMLGDRYMNRLQEGFGGISNCSVFPSIHSDQYIKDVHPKMIKLLKKYGPENGTFFVQGFATEKGLVFFDPALRFCGTLDIIPYSILFKINPLHWMINHSLTGIMDENNEMEMMDWKLKGKKVVQLSLHVNVGKIKKISGLEKVEEMPDVYEVVQLLFEGDYVDKPGTLQQVLARAFIICDDYNKAVKCIMEIYESVKVINSNGDNMLMPFKPYGIQESLLSTN